MASNDWHLTKGVDDFLAAAGDFLRSRPALHTTALSAIQKMRTHGPGALGARSPLFGQLERAGEVHAAFYISRGPTPPACPRAGRRPRRPPGRPQIGRASCRETVSTTGVARGHSRS